MKWWSSKLNIARHAVMIHRYVSSLGRRNQYVKAHLMSLSLVCVCCCWLFTHMSHSHKMLDNRIYLRYLHIHTHTCISFLFVGLGRQFFDYLFCRLAPKVSFFLHVHCGSDIVCDAEKKTHTHFICHSVFLPFSSF